MSFIRSAFLILLSGLGSQCAHAECAPPTERLTEVRFEVEGQDTPSVRLSELNWFVGAWRGSVFGLSVEHVVLDEVGEQLPGLVRLFNDETVVLYELSSFVVEEGVLIYRNRLFDAGLSVQQSATGDMMSREVIAAEDGIVFFDGITFAPNGTDCALVSFVLPNAEGVSEKHTVIYTRIHAK